MKNKIYSEEIQLTAQNLRVIDDSLFRLIVSRKDVCQEILQTLLDDKHLRVLHVTPQDTIVSLHRGLILDCLCELRDGHIVNIEVQRGNKNDDIRRCRLHLSSITANSTPKGTDFADIPNVTIIYITEYDALGNNQTITYTEMCQLRKTDGTYIPVKDGGLIIYANTCIKDDSDKSELLDLFLKKDSFDNKKFPHLSNAVKYFKDNREGVMEMCQIVEDFAKKYAQEYAQEYAKEKANERNIEIAKQLVATTNLNDKEIANATSLNVEEVEKLRNIN